MQYWCTKEWPNILHDVMKLYTKKWNHVVTINSNGDSKLIPKAQRGNKQRNMVENVNK